MEKTLHKSDPVTEVPSAKLSAKKLAAKASFSKYMAKRERNKNNSSVGPSWGGRKGN
jgi:hypothetical protein